jgi:hypothetical protein
MTHGQSGVKNGPRTRRKGLGAGRSPAPSVLKKFNKFYLSFFVPGLALLLAAGCGARPSPQGTDQPKGSEPQAAGGQAAGEPTAPGKAFKEAAAAAGEAEKAEIRGKPLRLWVAQLASPNKDEVLDALGHLQLAGPLAAYALAEVEKLAKHEDSEIAEDAQKTIKKIKGP